MELEEALKKITELETKVTTLEKENTDYKAGSDTLSQQIKDKEMEITTLKGKFSEQNLNFKKLRDYSDAEKELLTEKEKEIIERQEAQEEAVKKFQEEQKNFQKTQRDALVDSLAMKKAGGNREIADKIKVTLNKIKDIETKATEQDLTSEIDFAFNGLALKTAPDPLQQANNEVGFTPTFSPQGENFAETAEGKGLASVLGLSQAQPESK